MKNIFSLAILIMALTFSQRGQAHDFVAISPSGQYLYYNISNGSVVVTKQGNIPFHIWYANSMTGSVVIPDSVTHNGIVYPVAAIGDSAFCDCSGMTSVTIPNSVTSIGSYAFKGCSGLTSVTIPDSVTRIGSYAFYGCSGLTSVTIPNSVTSIGSYAFKGCSGLISVTIGRGVTSIGGGAFVYCSVLSSVFFNADSCFSASTIFDYNNTITNFVIGNTVRIIPDMLCWNLDLITTITIPNSVTSIGDNAFFSCSGLTSVTIGNSVTSIGDGAFSCCSGLTSVTIPNSVTSIGNHAFSGCSSLTSVIIPNSVNHIGNNAFASYNLDSVFFYADSCILGNAPWGDSNHIVSFVIGDGVNTIPDNLCKEMVNLTSLIISNSVINIGRSSFQGCTSLTSVIIPNSVTNIGDSAFKDCSTLTSATISNSVTNIGDFAFMNCSSLISMTIPNSVINIRRSSFQGCTSLTSLTIPNSVVSIGYYAFYGCGGLTTVTIPNSVTNISDCAFCYCSSLKTVTIGSAVTFIGHNAFGYCPLRSFYCMATTPPTVNNGLDIIFYYPYIPQKIYVPCNSVMSYRNDEKWGTLSSKINGTPFLDYTCNFNTSNDSMGYVRFDVMNCDSNITVTAFANIGHQFIGWGDGETDNPRIFHITSDTMMTAFFDYITYSIFSQPSNSIYGTVTVNGNFRYGDTVILTASANYGYHFLRWSDNNTENPRTVVVSQNASYTAYFEPNNYYVNVLSDNIVQGTVNGGGAITYHDTCCISAIPATNYHFSHWNDGDSNASRCFTVEEDITLIAYFEINRHQLIVLPNDSALGTVTGSGIYDHGTEVTVSAISAPGSRFIRWNDNSQLASRTVTITKDMQLMAIFMPVDTVIVHDTSNVDVHDTTYVNVPYAVHDTTYIDVHDTTYIDVPYAVHDTTIVVDTLTLTEYVPVHDTTYIDIHDTTFVPVHDTTYVNVHDTTFITLTDTVTNTVYDTITNTVFDTVTNTIYDTTIVYSTDTLWLHDTVFVHDTIFIYDTIYVGVDEVETVSAKIYTNNGQIVVDGAERNTVWLYDVNGRILATKQDEYSPLYFNVPASGTYLIKVGHHPARKVVVIR